MILWRKSADRGLKVPRIFVSIGKGREKPKPIAMTGGRESKRIEGQNGNQSAFGLNEKYHGEFDPGSERTLAARLKHASRAARCSNAP